MIKSVTIINHLGERITLDLFHPESSGFLIKSITGLGPVKATVNTTELASGDGAIDNSARLETRNIVLNLSFYDELENVETIRLRSYQYFPVKRNITIIVKTDQRECYAVGRVESNEPDIFSKEEGCQVSIICPDPFFYSTENQEITFYGTSPGFEFPYENASVNSKVTEFGIINVQTTGSLYYPGDSEVGVTLTIEAIGSASGIVIYDVTSKQVIRINDDRLNKIMGSGISAGDAITMTTERGAKRITITRNGETKNILNALDRPIAWFKLYKGINTFTYTAASGLTNLRFRLENRIIYEGI
jgi:hypothetical protein